MYRFHSFNFEYRVLKCHGKYCVKGSWLRIMKLNPERKKKEKNEILSLSRENTFFN